MLYYYWRRSSSRNENKKTTPPLQGIPASRFRCPTCQSASRRRHIFNDTDTNNVRWTPGLAGLFACWSMTWPLTPLLRLDKLAVWISRLARRVLTWTASRDCQGLSRKFVYLFSMKYSPVNCLHVSSSTARPPRSLPRLD